MENNTVDTIIGLNVILKGNIKNTGSIQVNGTIEGEVRSDENIYIGDTAKVKGPVVAHIIEVSGEINGVIEASEKLEIKPTGKVTGDINAKSLIIHQGATFVGKSIMPAEGKSIASISTATTHTEPEAPKSAEKATEEASEKSEKVDKDPLGFFKK